MALNPLVPTDDRIIETDEQDSFEPSKTYRLDFRTGRVRGTVDGERSLRQFVRMALATERFRYLIYDSDYGSEIDEVITQDSSPELLESEIPRVIREALIVDERIDNVTNFIIERSQDAYFVTFDIDTNDGWRLSFETEVNV